MEDHTDLCLVLVILVLRQEREMMQKVSPEYLVTVSYLYGILVMCNIDDVNIYITI